MEILDVWCLVDIICGRESLGLWNGIRRHPFTSLITLEQRSIALVATQHISSVSRSQLGA